MYHVGFGGGGRGQRSWRLRFLEAETGEKWILTVALLSWPHETLSKPLTFRTVRQLSPSYSKILVGRPFATAAIGS